MATIKLCSSSSWRVWGRLRSTSTARVWQRWLHSKGNSNWSKRGLCWSKRSFTVGRIYFLRPRSASINGNGEKSRKVQPLSSSVQYTMRWPMMERKPKLKRSKHRPWLRTRWSGGFVQSPSSTAFSVSASKLTMPSEKAPLNVGRCFKKPSSHSSQVKN